jgi:hypothetical protein
MAHFAQIHNNTVINVIVVNNQVLLNDAGVEQESLGVQFCQDLMGGTWIQTSYNNNFRKQYAGIGYTYDTSADVFVSPAPYDSWSLDSNHDWQPPTPMPTDDKIYIWSEDNLSWTEITNSPMGV